jgi:hypothetical protein
MDLEAQTVPSPATGLNSHHGHEASLVSPSVVRPSDFLRPRAISRPITPAAPPPPKPEKPIDRDEREALVSRNSLPRGSRAGYKQQAGKTRTNRASFLVLFHLQILLREKDCRLTGQTSLTGLDTRIPQAPHLLRCPPP